MFLDFCLFTQCWPLDLTFAGVENCIFWSLGWTQGDQALCQSCLRTATYFKSCQSKQVWGLYYRSRCNNWYGKSSYLISEFLSLNSLKFWSLGRATSRLVLPKPSKSSWNSLILIHKNVSNVLIFPQSNDHTVNSKTCTSYRDMFSLSSCIASVACKIKGGSIFLYIPSLPFRNEGRASSRTKFPSAAKRFQFDFKPW